METIEVNTTELVQFATGQVPGAIVANVSGQKKALIVKQRGTDTVTFAVENLATGDAVEETDDTPTPAA